MTDAQDFRTDLELFALAGSLLAEAGFAQEEVRLSNGLVLLSENAYSIVALTATPTLHDLIAAESHIAALLSERIHGADVGPKLWDAYVVLLTQEQPPDQGTGLQPLFSLAYNTRSSRRIARAGVEPTLSAVRRALTAFVPPPRLQDAGLATVPLLALSAALVTQGVDEVLATRAVEAYRQGGHLDDVF